jgi:hypothetical protein
MNDSLIRGKSGSPKNSKGRFPNSSSIFKSPPLAISSLTILFIFCLLSKSHDRLLLDNAEAIAVLPLLILGFAPYFSNHSTISNDYTLIAACKGVLMSLPSYLGSQPPSKRVKTRSTLSCSIASIREIFEGD